MNNGQQFFSRLLFVGFLLALLVLLDNAFGAVRYNLAQIVEIDIDTLLRWRRANGLKTVLSPNSSGHEIGLLQRILSSDRAIYPEGKITNYYGILTQNAVSSFQKKYDLPQTGHADTLTISKLNQILFVYLCPQSTAAQPDLLKQVDEQVLLPADYIPPLLVDISGAVRTTGVVCLRKDIVPHLTQMFLDAKKDGIDLAVTSGYRNPWIQRYLYNLLSPPNNTGALKAIARPGASEHQLGTTVDLTDASIGYAGADDRFAFSIGGGCGSLPMPIDTALLSVILRAGSLTPDINMNRGIGDLSVMILRKKFIVKNFF